jgi:hypothetical protein
MLKALDIRYRSRWFIGPIRAQIFDGVRWIWLSKVGTERQRMIDKNYRRSMTLLWGMGPDRLWVEGVLPERLRASLVSALNLGVSE